MTQIEEKLAVVSIPVRNSRITLDWCREKIVVGHVTGYFCYESHPVIAPNSVWASIRRLLELYDRYENESRDPRIILVLKFEDKDMAMQCRLKFS